MANPISRRNFLVASLAVPLVAAASPAFAIDEHDQFAAAATKYGVPASVLAAVAYGQSRWEDHAGAPSTSLGYGPMHLIDGAAAQQARRAAGKDGAAVIDTLGQAAKLTGLSKEALRTDPAANIAGAAAVIAANQKQLGHSTGTATDPATWYAAIATSSGFTSASGERTFADDVMIDLRNGTSKKTSGVTLSLAPTRVGNVTPQRTVITRRVEESQRHRQNGPIDAPRGLDVEWIEAPYEQYGPNPGDYGNHDLGFRPKSPTLNQLVIHDTEGSYASAIELVQDPTYLAWNYTVRSADGHIAQHLHPKDIGWHAGNWYVNMHAIGVEHEGYAATGATWYTESLYRNSARLVSYLCREYCIPMDREHIIGHDQVPAIATPYIPGMHWDPGPYWDWEHYFELLGAPLHHGTSHRPVHRGDVVRILPGFDDNRQPVSGCGTDPGAACPIQGTNFVTLRTGPSNSAPLVNDIGLHQDGQPASTYVSDISARAAAGVDFVVADVSDDWTAIWYLGLQAWFYNPHKTPTARVVANGRKITPRQAGTKIYGRAYPEASAYSNPDDVQALAPLIYTADPGQEYVVADAQVPTDYYKAQTFSLDTPDDHIDIIGKERYYLISFGHRVAYILADDVTWTHD
ncbi:N-acetylmuramoyl-L-alanine amidase [Leekyejoonella antrihumi]|uniref:N-acetylmuramoyl-L-alanine amidase n=1 Tax=Leekyejoonella antrihumi TaxID=1660198 RepID=A0A563E3M6_9MICO|nr:N-acetylmuramoyl-L-alanine amidase [Leekyejoonella antrihumi]TWP36494.1 N-acetylmuramoyl-L-alanine amidase [Leekyejoonella antrihumi]